ncbi:hypothetical protein GBA52_015737 [Prunus armeniaca]|nr:hypothetical protein GBA52_015737 [Prunus armeniaca]
MVLKKEQEYDLLINISNIENRGCKQGHIMSMAQISSLRNEGPQGLNFLCGPRTPLNIFWRERGQRNAGGGYCLVPTCYNAFRPPFSSTSLFIALSMRREIPHSSCPLTKVLHLSSPWILKNSRSAITLYRSKNFKMA